MSAGRVPSKYSNRLRRIIDQIGQEIGDHEDRLIIVEAGTSSIDSTSIDINGTTSETVSDPTDYGQELIRTVNKVTAAGTHTVTLTGRLPGSTAVATAAAQVESAAFVCKSGKYGDAWTWYITFNSGWVLS